MINNDFENREATRGATFGKKLIFLVIGGSIGAALALLLAPKSGRELREDIAGFAGKRYNDALVAANSVQNQVSDIYAIAKEAGGEVLDVVSTGASRIREEVKSDAGEIVAIMEDSAALASRKLERIV